MPTTPSPTVAPTLATPIPTLAPSTPAQTVAPTLRPTLAPTAPACANPQSATTQFVRTGTEPAGIAIDAQGRRAYVADTKQSSLYVFDLCSGSAVAFVPTGQQPHQVALAAGRAFVPNYVDQSISVVDTSTNQLIATIMAGGLGVATNPLTQRLYAAEGPRGVVILDAVSYRRLGAFAVPSDANVWALAADPATNRVYATDIANPRVLVFDGTSGVLLRSIAIAAVSRFGIALGAAGQVLVAGYTDAKPELAVIDGASGAIVARRLIAKWTNSVAYQARTGKAYTVSTADLSITTIELGPSAAISIIRVPDSVGAIVINPVNGNSIASAPGGPAAPQLPFLPTVPIVRP